MKDEITQKDISIITRSIGRPPRGIIDIAARCVCKNPIVARCRPNLSNGEPFPTHYYLVHPETIKFISTLEANGSLQELNSQLAESKSFQEAYYAAHISYLKDRQVYGSDERIQDFSAGGMPKYIKCLHAHIAHSLAVNSKGASKYTYTPEGVNPVGNYLIKRYPEIFDYSICRCKVPYNMAPTRRAVIDCGTNTIRLLIADQYPANCSPNSSGSKPFLKDLLPRKMRINRLGYKLNETGLLDKVSLQKTFDACRDYKKYIDKFSPEEVIFIATSASRDAKNSDELIAGVKEILGISPNIIDGSKEAEYSYKGVIAAANAKQGKENCYSTVIDIGGGSTEIAIGQNDLITSYSMQVGAIRLSELFFTSLPPKDAEQQLASDFVNTEIDKAFKVIFSNERFLSEISAKSDPKTADKPLEIIIYGVAGTITTITANALALPKYLPEIIDKTVLSLDETISSCDQLLGKTYEELESLPFMHKGRIDSMAAGCIIYKQVLLRLIDEFNKRGFICKNIITSEHDILDGVALYWGK